MQIQINAATRLVTAANAADAGKIVLWIEKATGVKGTPKGKSGKVETVVFKVKEGKDVLTLTVSLDQTQGGMLSLEGESKLLGHFGEVSEKTGRQTILGFKNELRQLINDENKEIAPQTVAILKKLISAKSKIEV